MRRYSMRDDRECAVPVADHAPARRVAAHDAGLVLLIDRTFWIATSVLNAKVENLRHDPRVSLAIDGTGEHPYVAQGRVLVHRSCGDFPQLVDCFAAKYDGWDVTDESQDGPRVLLEVPVDRWLLGAG